MKKNVLADQNLVRTSLYVIFAILLVVLPVFYDFSSAEEPSMLLGPHDALADVEEGEASDALDGPCLSSYHLAFTTPCVPPEVVRFLFLADETFFRQYLTLVSFTVRPPPIL